MTLKYGATDIHSEYVLLITLTRQQCLRKRASILRLYLSYFYFTVDFFFLLSRVRMGRTERCVVSLWIMYDGK